MQLAFHTVHTPIQGKPEVVESYKQKIKDGMNHGNEQYAAMVHSLDENVGRILDAIDDLGVADNTVVIFTSDNGGFINDFEGKQVTDNSPLCSGKGSLYEGGIRVPTIIRWPGVTKAGSVSSEPISSVDYYSTILSITGLKGTKSHNRNVDRVSITSLLENPDASLGREALFFHYPHYYQTTTPVSAVRVGDWKLMSYYEDSSLELYNLAEDPGEKNNRASEKPDIAKALLYRLTDCLTQIDAQLPVQPDVQ